MLFAIIISCEISFWLFIIAGLLARYIFKHTTLSNTLLICAPFVDLILLIVSILDLRSGAEATVAHALAAIYIGISVAFGPQMIKWADAHFAYRYAKGPKPSPAPKYGPEHARHERKQWLRHVFAWAIGMLLMGGAILVIGNDKAASFRSMMLIWTLILIGDGIVTYSYRVLPRTEKQPVSPARQPLQQQSRRPRDPLQRP